MTARRQWAIVGVVVALLAVGLFAATRMLGDELFPVTIGAPAPQFSAVEVTASGARGPVRTLDDYRGKAVLLNIWATWCEPCRAEMPSIQALHERYAQRGLKVVAVSVDDPGADRQVRDFASQFGLTFDILHDLSGDIQRQYQTTGVPETVLIGPDGRILRKQIGAADWNSAANRALVAQLLGAPGDTALAVPGLTSRAAAHGRALDARHLRRRPPPPARAGAPPPARGASPNDCSTRPPHSRSPSCSGWW